MKYLSKISLILGILTLFGTAHVYAAPPVVTSFSVSPSNINAGDKVSLSWSSQNSSGCDLSGGHFGGGKGISGSAIDYPKNTTTYTITCFNPFMNEAPNSRSLTVYVNGSPAPAYQTPTPTPSYIPQSPSQTQYINTACATSPTSPKIGEAVTFSSAASGGVTPYTYSWSGAVSGTGQSIVTSFTTAGTKTATVTAVDFAGRSAQSSCGVNILSGTPTPPQAGGSGSGKVEGATTVCKQITVCFDQNTGKVTEAPAQTNKVVSAPTVKPTVANNSPKTTATPFLATIFNVEGDVWGKIKSLVIWYVVILLVIILIVLTYMGIKRMKNKKITAESDQEKRNT